MKWSQANVEKYIVRVTFGRVRLHGVVARWMLIEVLVAPILNCEVKFDIRCEPKLPRENMERVPWARAFIPLP